MEKKKKTRFIVVWLLITAAFLAGSLLVPGHGKSESVQEAMRDAVLHGTNRISLFGLKDVNPAYISSLVVVGALLLAVLTYGDPQTTLTFALSKDGVYDVDTGEYTIHLRVEDGAIAFVDSPCPDHLCEGFGRLKAQGDWAACMPARASLTIQ